ncbi:hypothetical protein CAEBREN_02875 [Caenorhabditis brenneri]|uniref:Uncharacterized protein n=1 Tax=Caenorhabditis brenneri TaxID=135651 RepID=G0NUB6_CAEBE|nr:hypothetical protein CAEBREN_02875 [Caenorhabditis brenneri]
MQAVSLVEPEIGEPVRIVNNETVAALNNFPIALPYKNPATGGNQFALNQAGPNVNQQTARVTLTMQGDPATELNQAMINEGKREIEGYPTFPIMLDQLNLPAPVDQGIGNMLALLSGMPFSQIPPQAVSTCNTPSFAMNPMALMTFPERPTIPSGTQFAVSRMPTAPISFSETPYTPTNQQIPGFIPQTSTTIPQFPRPSLTVSNSPIRYQMSTFPLDSPSSSSPLAMNNEDLLTNSNRKRRGFFEGKETSQDRSNMWPDKRSRPETPFLYQPSTEHPERNMENEERLRLPTPPTSRAEGELRIENLAEAFRMELNKKCEEFASLQKTYKICLERAKNDLEREKAANIQKEAEFQEMKRAVNIKYSKIINDAQKQLEENYALKLSQQEKELERRHQVELAKQERKFQELMKVESQKWEMQIQEEKKAAKTNLENRLAMREKEIQNFNQTEGKKAMAFITAGLRSMHNKCDKNVERSDMIKIQKQKPMQEMTWYVIII